LLVHVVKDSSEGAKEWVRFWAEVEEGASGSRSVASSWGLFFLFFLACSAAVAGLFRMASLAAVVLLGVKSLEEIGIGMAG
jgi:hypothetical protein